VLLLAHIPHALLFFLLGSGGVLAFTYLVWGGSTRYYGHLFLVLLASLWIARIAPPTESFRPPDRRFRVHALPWRNSGLTVILVLQVLAGAILYLEDLRKPFSSAQRTASFLQRSGLGTLPSAGSPSLPASALAGHLDREIFDLEKGRLGTFVAWGVKGGKIQPGEVVDRVRPLLTSASPALLLVMGDSLPQDTRGPGIRLVAYFPLLSASWSITYVHPLGLSQCTPPPSRIFAKTRTTHGIHCQC
jgi:hypothetical protein